MANTAGAIIQAAFTPNGLPSLGIPSLNPLRINKIAIKQNPESPVNIEIVMKNVDLTGINTLKFSKIR